jgi:hypothetical protein
MRDRTRFVGALFIAWAPIQVAMSLWLVKLFARGRPAGAAAVVFWLITYVVAAWSAIVGARLLEHDLRARPWGVALAAVLVYFFPLGTLVGTYAMWALLRLEPSLV